MMRACVGVTALVALLTAVPAWAQTTRRVGVTLGYPAQVGILWHVSSRIAIRPDIGFGAGSSDTESASSEILPGVPGTKIQVESSSHSVNGRITALLTVVRWDQAGVYVAPFYSYTTGSSSTTTTITPAPIPLPGVPPRGPQTNTTTSDTRAHAGGGSIGVQVSVHDRVALFAETGLRYTETSGSAGARTTSRLWSSSGAIGAVLYF